MGPAARIYVYAGGTSCPSIDDVRVVRVEAASGLAGKGAAAPAPAPPGGEGGYHPMVAGRATRKVQEVVQPWQSRGVTTEDDGRAREEREIARRACCEHLKEEERRLRSTTTLPPLSTTARPKLGCCQKIDFRAGSLAANASGTYEIDPSFEAFGTVYRLQGPGPRRVENWSTIIMFDPWSSKWLLTSRLPHCGAIYGVGKAGPRSSCPAENGASGTAVSTATFPSAASERHRRHPRHSTSRPRSPACSGTREA
ncbi:unnamed protein product [Prorocentrum cordatum]|uniref:Uncharacterized protein n=1 Tax=Prorocentrum cordatum TaxID=2364126 RepID=A0ABN9R0N9_9DINO|nr:unnamed protein product [Polarella glacialis]